MNEGDNLRGESRDPSATLCDSVVWPIAAPFAEMTSLTQRGGGYGRCGPARPLPVLKRASRDANWCRRIEPSSVECFLELGLISPGRRSSQASQT